MKYLISIILVLLTINVSSQEVLDTVNNGSGPGSGNGEILYTAFQKVNKSITRVNDLTPITQSSTIDYYISQTPVGSDVTGDGTQLNPWATIKFALENTPDIVSNAATVTYYVDTGNYVFTGDEAFLLQEKIQKGASKVRLLGTLEAVLTGLTITQSSENPFRYNVSGVSWTTDQYMGYYVYSAALSDYIPIASNGTDWIEVPTIGLTISSIYKQRTFLNYGTITMLMQPYVQDNVLTIGNLTLNGNGRLKFSNGSPLGLFNLNSVTVVCRFLGSNNVNIQSCFIKNNLDGLRVENGKCTVIRSVIDGDGGDAGVLLKGGDFNFVDLIIRDQQYGFEFNPGNSVVNVNSALFEPTYSALLLKNLETVYYLEDGSSVFTNSLDTIILDDVDYLYNTMTDKNALAIFNSNNIKGTPNIDWIVLDNGKRVEPKDNYAVYIKNIHTPFTEAVYTNNIRYDTNLSFKEISYSQDTLTSVIIGTQEWTVYSLSYDDGLGGIYGACGTEYGNTYTSVAADRITALYPGWRMPTQADWQTLLSFAGTLSAPYVVTGTTYWAPGDGTNTTGLSVKGGQYTSGGVVQGTCGFPNVYFWGTDSYMNFSYPNASVTAGVGPTEKYIRLIKDEGSSGGTTVNLKDIVDFSADTAFFHVPIKAEADIIVNGNSIAPSGYNGELMIIYNGSLGPLSLFTPYSAAVGGYNLFEIYSNSDNSFSLLYDTIGYLNQTLATVYSIQAESKDPSSSAYVKDHLLTGDEVYKYSQLIGHNVNEYLEEDISNGSLRANIYYDLSLNDPDFGLLNFHYDYDGIKFQSYDLTPSSWDNDNLITKGYADTAYVKTGIYIKTSGIIADGDVTPDISGNLTWTYNGTTTASTIIIGFDNGVEGNFYTIIGNSSSFTITIQDAGNFSLQNDWLGGLNDVIVLYCVDGTNFIEISRSDN